jgi:acyl carrier protein
MTEEIIAPRLYGTLILESLVKDCKLDFFILFSSLGNLIYKLKYGQVGYNAGMEFLDAFASYKFHNQQLPFVSINWSDWLEVGMTIDSIISRNLNNPNIDYSTIIGDALTSLEGVQVLKWILMYGNSQIVVSPQDLFLLLKQIDDEEMRLFYLSEVYRTKNLSKNTTEYINASNDLEKVIVNIIKGHLGEDKIGIHDNFFDLGINSLDIIQLNKKLMQSIDQDISNLVWYEYPTVQLLADYFDRLKKENINAKQVGLDRSEQVNTGKLLLQKLRENLETNN